MHLIDLGIIVVYLLLMIAVGWWVARRAAQNSESYFLAGKSLPWWLIGIAHGSSGIDIGGTMWFVTMLFIYGVKGLFLLWIWPLFNVLFRMMYLGTWVRRSNVLTGAEWMRTRFGRGLGGELAYISVVVYAMVSVIGFLSYAFKPLGKFAQPFFPMDWSPNTYALIIMLVTGIYGVVGGMYSVVLNDVIQFGLILAAALIVAMVAILRTRPEQIQSLVPAGWDNLFFGWRLDLDWSTLMPSLQQVVYGPSGHGYSVFGFFITMLFLKGVLVSMAGPTPNYAIQHVLSTRSPREAALENMMMCLVSLAPRFLLVGGIAVLGIVFFSPDLRAMGRGVDFEAILPRVVAQYLPVGCKGLILAGMIAAFMSTFVSTVNSGVAYMVNDIYKRYLRPEAPPRHYVRLGYACSAAVILAGIGFGYSTFNVHSVTKWVTAALVPAFVIPNVLKWHWWRFNGHGFWAGMASGTLGALVIPLLPQLARLLADALDARLSSAWIKVLRILGQWQVHDIWLFLSILALSTVVSVVVCLLTKPEPSDVLQRFYRAVRPWGFWGPIHEQCRAETPDIQRNRDCVRDWFNIAVGLVWQIAMVALPIYLVLQQYGRMWICTAVFAATSLLLKFTWYDKLGPAEMYLSDSRPLKPPA